jgi:glutathione S-transferase
MTVLFSLRLKGPSLSAHPSLAAWHARVLARPAVAKIAAEIAAADRELSPALNKGS